ncbi:hypothetical protein HRE53_29390 (plasmid) [Acaryochloris sp. 'Moss Beach']|uniref:hypothetical protein n=1 Tax=Acaryochloris TaxID=155977 RepID=UPI001BB04BAE|nr:MULTISPECIES: hypothetical protein [Acaryochloris]QUY45799.1 hypothetical protein I1H34_29070 [Acaryochloris marina S15]UJB72874.1 hypothetical protein HRE53_29390 [Acaryochloris sp. 'Moss Beach']
MQHLQVKPGSGAKARLCDGDIADLGCAKLLLVLGHPLSHHLKPIIDSTAAPGTCTAASGFSSLNILTNNPSFPFANLPETFLYPRFRQNLADSTLALHQIGLFRSDS